MKKKLRLIGEEKKVLFGDMSRVCFQRSPAYTSSGSGNIKLAILVKAMFFCGYLIARMLKNREKVE